TFTSSSSAISAAYYVINQVMTDGYLGSDGKIEKIYARFSQGLERLHRQYPNLIEGPWGLGAMIGLTVFKGDMEKSKQFTLKLFDNGVLSFMAGGNPTRVRFLPPVGAVTMEDIDQVVSII